MSGDENVTPESESSAETAPGESAADEAAETVNESTTDTDTGSSSDNAPAEEPAPEASGDTEEATDSDGKPRRNFMVEVAAAGIGALVGLVPTVLGTLFFLNPLIRRDQVTGAGLKPREGGPEKDADGFIKLPVTLEALPDDGTPVKYNVVDDIVDAWNMFPSQDIGSIWMRKIGEQVIAFNTICPHLGCSIEHRAGQGDFYCPCHLSAFDLEGKSLNPTPPRGMDPQDLKVNDDGSIWVKYQKFRGAISERVEI